MALTFTLSTARCRGVPQVSLLSIQLSPMSGQQLDQINIAKVGSHMEGRLTLSLLWVETCLSGDQKLCHILKVILCS